MSWEGFELMLTLSQKPWKGFPSLESDCISDSAFYFQFLIIRSNAKPVFLNISFNLNSNISPQYWIYVMLMKNTRTRRLYLVLENPFVIDDGSIFYHYLVSPKLIMMINILHIRSAYEMHVTWLKKSKIFPLILGCLTVFLSMRNAIIFWKCSPITAAAHGGT